MKILAAAVATLLLGTSAQAQTLDPKVAAAAIATQTLAKPLVLWTYKWSTGLPPTALPPVATFLCVLTGFTGKLAGAGELAQLYVDKAAAGGARFMLGGHSQQSEFKVTATCAAKEQFVRGNTVTQLQETTFEPVSGNGCAAKTSSMGTGPGAMFVAGFSGRFAGDGESVSAVTAGKSGAVTVESCSGSASGAVLWIGQLFCTPVYRTATGTSTDVGKSTFIASYKSNWQNSLWQEFVGGLSDNSNIDVVQTGSVYPALTNDALCGIAALRGKFNGYGENARVEPAYQNGQKWWMVSVSKGLGATLPSISVAVRCFARDQRLK